MAKPQILIVGAGPTGMIFALSLHQLNIPFRIIDASTGPGLASRAMGLHARTLELYRTFGIAEEVDAASIHTLNAQIRTVDFSGKPYRVATMPFNNIGKGISKYPYISQYPQDEHERLLQCHLTNLGVNVERSTFLTTLQQIAAGADVVITGPNGEEKLTFTYVIGCDGAHSKVRHSIDVGFSGGTYTQAFYVADVKLDDTVKNDFFVTLNGSTVCIRMPVRTGMTRLIGCVPKEIDRSADVKFSDIQESAENLLDAKIAEVNWFSHYSVHHRVADKFRIDNVFLCGDACHLHSPMGGQGMNTGIGDAINLAWKLGHVLQGRASEDILDSYNTERRAFAEKLVNTTDAMFGRVIQDNLFGVIIRRVLWPLFMAIVTRFTIVRNNAFRFMSQIHISYYQSNVSEGSVGAIKAGDRLPWIDYGDGTDNHDPFDGINWQLHVYGDAPVHLEELKWIEVHRFPFDQYARKVGFRDGAVYLTRPDTYTALVMDRFDLDTLRRYVQKWKLTA